MKKFLAIFAILLVAASQVSAQTATFTWTPTPTFTPSPQPGISEIGGGTDCGNGIPCGPLPWSLPAWPPLASPTAIPTVQATFLANPVPSGTPTPTLTPTLFFDNGQFENSLATYQAVSAGTPYVVTNPEGTPITSGSAMADMGANTGTLFSYLKGLVGLNTGWTGVLLTFVVVLFGGFLAIKVLTFLVPIFLAILGLFKRLFDVVMEFLPL